jgi:hypothetical protein
MKLWKEFAIEPTLFANYYLGNEILAGLGFEHGRIVGALPKKWSRAVRNHALVHTEMQQAKLVERLNDLKTAILPRIHPYDGGRPWRDQAFECHQLVPFDGILVGGPAPVQGCIDTTLGLAGQQAWTHSRQLSIQRSSAPLAAVLKPLLCTAHEVIIVDAFFNPSVKVAQSKWLRPLRALAAQLSADGRVTRFEMHALSSRNDPWPAGLFVQHCRNNLAPALPKGISLDAMLWKERNGGLQFHERLIVTDVGGVLVDPGIDDGAPGETYDLRLLSKVEVPVYLKKFTQATAPYDLIDQQRITGT